MDSSALGPEIRFIQPGEALPAPAECCEPARLRGLSRRGLFAAGVMMPALAATRAQAATEDYPPLLEDLKLEQVPGQPIYFTIGHAAVPASRNEGHTSNAGFIVTEEGVVVFDTLGTPSLGWALLGKIRSVTDKPVRYVVLSHYHADHIYGLQAFRDHTSAVIVSQAQGRNYTAEGNLDDEAAGPRLAQRREALAPWVNDKTRIVLPELTFKVAAEIALGSFNLKLIYAGPAHSMSDVMLLVEPAGVLFAGDIVQNGRIPFMASAAVDTRNWLKGLDTVQSIAPQYIIPGHGLPSTSAEQAIGFTRDYIHYLRKTMGDAVDNWQDFDAAYAATDWSAYARFPAFEASNRGNAYRVFLDLEKEGFAAKPDAGQPSKP